MDAMEEDPIVATSSSFPEGVPDVQDSTPSYVPPSTCMPLSQALHVHVADPFISLSPPVFALYLSVV